MVLKFHEILRQLIEENDMTSKKACDGLEYCPFRLLAVLCRESREPDFSILVRIFARLLSCFY